MKKYLSVVLVAALVVSLFPIQALLIGNTIQASGPALEGEGTVDSPYMVSSADDLNEVRLDLNAHYKQQADIDLEEYLHENGLGYAQWESAGWLPIGNHEEPFTGTFDGNGFLVSNLTIDRSDTNHIGLFGAVGTNGQLINISLKNTEVHGQQYTGGLVGYLDGTIVNSSVQGNIAGFEDVGGLVGYVASQGGINRCFTIGNVTGSGDQIGGLVGNNNAEINESYATVEIDGNNFTGSLVGMNNGSVSKSYYNVDINGQDDPGKGYPRATEDLKEESTYEEWDFGTVWFIDTSINAGFPYFMSANANLSKLEISGGTEIYELAFDANVEEYELTVGYEVGEIIVTPTVDERNAIVEVNGIEVESGEESASIALNVGTNRVTVKVNAHNGNTKIYLITVEREAPFSLMYVAEDNGFIIGDAVQTVSKGKHGSTVEAVPDEGYRFVEWSDGSRINPRTDQNVSDNIHVTALFETWVTTTFILDDDEAEMETLILGNDRLRNDTNANIDHPDQNTLRPGDEDGAYEYKYFSQTFTPTVSGTYHFGNSQANVDTAMIIYKEEFDKDNPTKNFIGFNDDYDRQIVLMPEGSMCGPYIIRCPGIEAELEAYVSYIIITTTFNPEHSFNIEFPLEFFISGPANVEEGNIVLLPIVYSSLISDGNKVSISDADVNILDYEGILVIELLDSFDNIKDVALTKEQLQVLKERQATIRIIKDDVELNIPASIFDENEDLVIHIERLMKDPEQILESNLSSSSIYRFTLRQGDQYLDVFDHEIQLIFALEEDGVSAPDEMKLYYLNESEGEWELIGGEYADGKITAWTTHFSIFGVFHPSALDSEEEVVEDEVIEETNEGRIIEEGEKLPETATQSYNLIIIGLTLLIIGSSLVIYRRRSLKTFL